MSIAVTAILMALISFAVFRAHGKVKESVRKIEVQHYRRHIQYLDENPFFVQGDCAYYTNEAFPGVLFTVTCEGSERPSF